MKPPRRSTVSPCPELPWFGHERHAPAGLLARGSLRRCPPSQDEPQWLRPIGRLDIRSPLTVAGTAQFEALRLSLRSRSTLSGTGASQRDSNEVSAESFLNHLDEVKNGVRTLRRVPN